MNPFMQSLYQEFKQYLYRLFGITFDEGKLKVAENA